MERVIPPSSTISDSFGSQSMNTVAAEVALKATMTQAFRVATAYGTWRYRENGTYHFTNAWQERTCELTSVLLSPHDD